MSRTSSQAEKQAYWERRLWELIAPIPISDFLILTWSLEAFRRKRSTGLTSFLRMPGTFDDHGWKGKFFIPPWNVDAVLNERLSLGSENQVAHRYLNLRSWNAVSKLYKTYAGLANVESTKDFTDGEIVSALPRLFWPQYEWQVGFESAFRLGRAWYVYNVPSANEVFLDRYGVDTSLFLRAAFALYSLSIRNPYVSMSSLEQIGINVRQLRAVFAAIGGRLSEHVELAQTIRDPYLPRDFRRSTIKERPLVGFEVSGKFQIVIPSPEYLLLRMSDGLYYDIVSSSDARREAGERFERLCFMMLEHYLSPDYYIEGEVVTSYGRGADIMIRGRSCELDVVVECKSRRLPTRVLTSKSPWEEFSDDFEDIVKGIVQIWRTEWDLHPHRERLVFGVVLLYDPWTVMGSASVKDLLDRARQKADRIGVPEESRIPVVLSGYHDFETSVRKYDIIDIYEVATRFSAGEFHGYLLSGALSSIEKPRRDVPWFNYRDLIEASVPGIFGAE